jgi:hypothetical protein
MKDKLEELRKLDPACYEDIRRRVIIDADEDFEIYDTDQTFRENVDDTIIGCVCRACEKRGWNWQVQTWNASNEKFYIAYVIGDGKDAGAQKDSSAMAITEAYIKRLSA